MVLPRVGDGLQKDRVGLEGPVLDGAVHAHVVLGHYAARAQIGVSCLGVAGLPGLEAHVLPGGAEPAVGILRQQAVPGGGIGGEDGILVIGCAEAPAVQDDEHHFLIGKARCPDKGGPRHLRGLLQPQHAQHGGSHVAQTAVVQSNVPSLGVQNDEGHQIGGMGHVGLPFLII